MIYVLTEGSKFVGAATSVRRALRLAVAYSRKSEGTYCLKREAQALRNYVPAQVRGVTVTPLHENVFTDQVILERMES